MRYHGEFKVPGGKLVVADFALAGGRLSAVQVSGDFFLYPDHALDAINASLEGAAVEEITDRIIAALPPGAEMLGFGPADVAEAVRRGLP